MFGNYKTKRRSVNGQLIDLLKRNANSFDRIDHADAPNPNAVRLGNSAGNPNFTAQFDISILLKYFTLVPATGVFTAITAAGLLAAQPTLATQFGAFVFGNSDYAGGYAKSRSLFPMTIWSYESPFIYGNGWQGVGANVLDATAKAVLQTGDMVQPYTAVLGGVTYVAFVIVRCRQVGYGTLLDALNSDMFQTNLLRYVLSDTTATGLAQYEQNIKTLRQSLFGKASDDFVSPNSYKLPEQMQAGIVDIPLNATIDKEAVLATYVNYAVVNVQWSIFVRKVEKI